RWMLEDAGVSVLITRGGLAPELAASGLPVLDLGGAGGGLEGEPAVPPMPPEIDLPSSSLAYVMYTSGSTGRAKGVAGPHRAVAALVLESDYLRLAPGDRMGQAANTAFDAATLEIWGPLLNGGSVVVLEREATLDPRRLARTLVERRVGVLFVTPALFNLV